MTRADFVVIAVCAGVGEDVLFRATLQPLLGLWLAAAISAHVIADLVFLACAHSVLVSRRVPPKTSSVSPG